MATIKMKFRPSSVPETEGTLYYQVIHKRKVKWISTGYHVYPCEWDEEVGEVLIPQNSERKAELEKMQSQINWELKQWDSIIVEMGNQHKNVTINELCDAFNKTKTQKTVFMFPSNPQLSPSTSFLRVHVHLLLNLQIIRTEIPTSANNIPLPHNAT